MTSIEEKGSLDTLELDISTPEKNPSAKKVRFDFPASDDEKVKYSILYQ